MKRLLSIFVALLLAVAACGDNVDETTSSTASPPTSAATAVTPTTSPTTAPPATVGPTTPPTITSPPTGDFVSVFFPVDGLIAPVARLVPPGQDPATVAVTELLRGPSADEVAGTPPMWQVVDGAELVGVTVADGVATVDISEEFDSPTGTSGELMRLSALTYTLTDLPEVDEVVLLIDGKRLQYFGGHGWDITPSLTRTTFMENQGAFGSIAILDPAWWLPVANPVVVSGYAEGYEGKVMFGLYDNDGLELVVGEAEVVPTGWDLGVFDISIPYSVEFEQLGAVMVWDGSAGTGSQANLIEHSIWLTPVR